MLLRGGMLSAMKSGLFPKTKSTPAAASKMSAPAIVPSASSPASSYEDITTSQIQKIIAKQLAESKSGIPHAYLEVGQQLHHVCGISCLKCYSFQSNFGDSKRIKENHGVPISVNDFVIRATALALKEGPEANGNLDGLKTQILKNADQNSLSDISSEVKSLVERAHEGKLTPNEFQGGTFKHAYSLFTGAL
ncbi:unnamed protein product [Sphagnum troendelagicum]|uniref:2-oxoacid dehydrogenase acyltransferase catalytic domain-containing protein n=1 Tax=Sphagnum troendelagicum TaxID=128251 RepID=A0ABP0TFY7_9BRYO